MVGNGEVMVVIWCCFVFFGLVDDGDFVDFD